MKSHYSMIVQWSIEDEIYIVSLPEFGDNIRMVVPMQKQFSMANRC
jgi:hypothetical protein